jgi:hypothetical protein
MQRDLQQPFDSAAGALARSARVFFANFPFLAGVTLAVFVPGKLLFQWLSYLLDLPPEGIASYILMDFSDLFLGALAIPAAIHGLTAGASIGDSLRRGRKLWSRMFWNKFKVEMTVTLWALLLFIPGLIAMVKLALTEAVVALEAGEPDPLARSRELTEGHRWRVFGVMAPLLLLDFVGSFAVLSALPGVAHSRWMLAAADSLMAVVSMWTTVAGLLIYLGVTGAGESPAPERPIAKRGRSRR